MSSTPPESVPQGRPSPPWRGVVPWLAVVGAAGAVGVWAWWSVGRGGPSLEVVTPARAAAMGGPYAGSHACAVCHPGESAHHGGSGHSRTLRPAATSPLARRLAGRTVPDPERPGVTWSYSLDGGVFRTERRDPAAGALRRFDIDYVVGSGHHAATFVTLTDPHLPAALEHRMTLFTAPETVEVTPGQRSDDPLEGTTDHGRELTPRTTQRCFGCHATPVLEAESRAPGQAPLAPVAPLVPDVTCERCHGPALRHVEAARAGRTDLSMPFGERRWTAGTQLGLCGQCHRHPARFPAERIRPDDRELARFQPIGLMQSRCYKESQGRFTCLTCHDPHARTSSDRAAYIQVCRSCHDPLPARPAAGRPCPVDPRERCLDCHMPKVDCGQTILFTDHWVRVRKEGAGR